MRIIFTFFTAFLQSHLTAAEILVAPITEERSDLLLQCPSFIDLQTTLAASKQEELTIENRTDIPIRVGVYDSYQLAFDEKETEVLVSFDGRYQMISVNGSSTPSEKNTFLRILMDPTQERSRIASIVLKSTIVIFPGALKTIRAMPSSYISSLVCEDIGKHIIFSTPSQNKAQLAIEDLPDSLDYEKPTFRQPIEDISSLPLFQHLASTLFSEYKITPQKFCQKLREINRDRTTPIKDCTLLSNTPNLKIPKIIHTFYAKKTDEPATCLNPHQKKCLGISIETHSKALGWKHILWTAEPPITAEDLGAIAENVEIRSISLSRLPCLSEIEKLLNSKLYRRASVLFQYAVLAKYGGVVRGINRVIKQDIATIHSKFSFYASVDTSMVIGSEFLASTSGYSIIRNALTLVQREVNKTENSLLSEPDILSIDYQTKYASGPLYISFHQWATPGNDIIIFTPGPYK